MAQLLLRRFVRHCTPSDAVKRRFHVGRHLPLDEDRLEAEACFGHGLALLRFSLLPSNSCRLDERRRRSGSPRIPTRRPAAVQRRSMGSFSRSDSSPVTWSSSASVSITERSMTPLAPSLGSSSGNDDIWAEGRGSRSAAPSRGIAAYRNRALRPRLGANRSRSQPTAIRAVAIPLREAATRRGAKIWTRTTESLLYFDCFLGRLLASRAIRNPNLAGLRKRRTIAVNLRVHPNFEKLRRLPIVHRTIAPLLPALYIGPFFLTSEVRSGLRTELRRKSYAILRFIPSLVIWSHAQHTTGPTQHNRGRTANQAAQGSPQRISSSKRPAVIAKKSFSFSWAPGRYPGALSGSGPSPCWARWEYNSDGTGPVPPRFPTCAMAWTISKVTRRDSFTQLRTVLESRGGLRPPAQAVSWIEQSMPSTYYYDFLL